MALEIEKLLARLRNFIVPIRHRIIGNYHFLLKLHYCSIYCTRVTTEVYRNKHNF
jgi:hypothetical protein